MSHAQLGLRLRENHVELVAPKRAPGESESETETESESESSPSPARSEAERVGEAFARRAGWNYAGAARTRDLDSPSAISPRTRHASATLNTGQCVRWMKSTT